MVKHYTVKFREPGYDEDTEASGILTNVPDNGDDAFVERRYRELHPRQQITSFTVHGNVSDAEAARILGDVQAGNVPREPSSPARAAAARAGLDTSGAQPGQAVAPPAPAEAAPQTAAARNAQNKPGEPPK